MNKFAFIMFLLFISCINHKEEKEIIKPFAEINITEIISEKANNISENSLELTKLSKFVQNLDSQILVTGKRFHGAKDKCDLIFVDKNYQVLLFFDLHPEYGLSTSFFKVNNGDNFKYYYGRLYETAELVTLLNELGIDCMN